MLKLHTIDKQPDTRNSCNVPRFDFNSLQDTKNLITALKNHGIFIMSSLFTNQALDLLENEFDLLFSQHQRSIEIDDSEGCSKDLRIHSAEKNSALLQEAFCNNILFNNVCQTYTGKLGKRKTLIKHKEPIIFYKGNIITSYFLEKRKTFSKLNKRLIKS